MPNSGHEFDPYHQWLGIAPGDQPPNHYRLLGLQLFEASAEVIQHAADRQMAHLRTFQSGPRGAISQQLLNEIAAAKLCLLTAERKAAYDAELRAEQQAQEASEAGREALDSLFQTTRHKSSPRRARQSRARAGGRWPARIALLAMILGMLIIGAVYWYSRQISPATGRLVLIWPVAKRAGATVELDGQPRDLKVDSVSDNGTRVEFDLPPGVHKLRMARPGLAPIESSFTIIEGRSVKVIAPAFPRQVPGRLVLIWPISERAGATLEIDGRSRSPRNPDTDSKSPQLEFNLSPGEHTVRIVRGGSIVLEQDFKLLAGKRFTLTVGLAGSSRQARLLLVWPASQRAGATLEIDGRPYDPEKDADDASGDRLEFALEAGDHVLRVLRDPLAPFRHPLTLAAGRRVALRVPPAATWSADRVVLEWPAKERDGATLEIDGQPCPVGTLEAVAVGDEVILGLTPGKHVVRAERPGFEAFQHEVDNLSGVVRVPVTWRVLGAMGPSPERLDAARKQFQTQYQQADLFRQWQRETNPSKKHSLLTLLISKLSTDAAAMPRHSPQQLAAFEETLRLALDSDGYLAAHAVIVSMRGSGSYEDAELAAKEKEVFSRAVASRALDAVLPFLEKAKSEGRSFNVEEQKQIGNLFVGAPDLAQNYTTLARELESLQTTEILADTVATRAKAQLFLSVAKSRLPTPAAALDVGEKLTALVPPVMESSGEEGMRLADALIDASNNCRRRALAARLTDQRLLDRASKLADTTKELRSLLMQRGRVLEAEKAIEAGKATDAQYRLVGFWLASQRKYDEALRALRNVDDKTLSQLSGPLPDTAAGLSQRADALDREASSSKYSIRQRAALRAIVNHLRTLALEKNDNTLDTDARARLQSKLTPESRPSH